MNKDQSVKESIKGMFMCCFAINLRAEQKYKTYKIAHN